MTDQEGGEVRRLPGPRALSEKQIGESADAASLATQAGTGAGRTLAGAGLNVNLAPVLDVFRRAGNFIDSAQRSYSSNPARVATLGARFITAQQHVGVAATAKHFPGLGAAATDQDTDEVPVTLNVPAATLRNDDELPYRAAIAAGVKLVMVSWAVYPALDPRRPAGLSSKVIGGELRGRLHFRGVVISDELAAGALRAFGSIAHRAGLAAAAGVDLLICSESNPDDNTPTEGVDALQGLAAALAAGQISHASAEQAASLIIGLRSSLG
jgi:beta-N-acetylhexosaminidase